MQLIYGILKELRAADQQIDDATTVHKILTHLPYCFNHFVRVVQNEESIPIVSELFSRLHLEETNFNLRQGYSHEEALVTRIRNLVRSGCLPHSGRGAYSNFQRRKGYLPNHARSEQSLCNRCGEPGHFAKVCTTPAPLPSNFQGTCSYSARQSTEAHSIHKNSGDNPDITNEIEAVLAALSTDTSSDNEWVLDSGASRHFANNPSMSSTLEQSSSRNRIGLRPGPCDTRQREN